MKKSTKMIIEEFVHIRMLLGDIRQLLVRQRERYLKKDKEKES